MSSDSTHLTERERHAAADGTIAVDQRPGVEAHISACSACAADVGRIRTLMTHIHDTSTPEAQLDLLWPSIQARIEHRKVVPMPVETIPVTQPRRRYVRWISTTGVAAAVLIGSAIAFRHRVPASAAGTSTSADTSTALIAIADSARTYEREAQLLLDKFELQRAMLRPDVAQTFDRDLRVVDMAIAELKDAVARDPRNPALRQLLATSYRQKVDLLKRVDNAS
jgi:anti-sigma factor RsiW